MHRLQQFLTSILLPQIQAYESSVANGKDNAKTIMLSASIVESFLWLHLGTEIGAFPQPASRDIYEAYLTPFFQSLLSTDIKAMSEMKTGPVYVAHSNQSKAVVLRLGRFATVLVEKAMRREEIFSRELAGFSRPDRLRPVFQTFLILHSHLISRPSVESFTYQVSFADEQTWRHSWKAGCDSEEVMRADTTGGSISSLVCAGYLNLWNYAVKVTTTDQNLKGDPELASDLFRLTDRLKEMGRWRINLKNADTSSRFDDVRVRIMENVESEEKNDISRICSREIRESMNSAFQVWFSAALIPVPVLA
jgi:hypothetical protein